MDDKNENIQDILQEKIPPEEAVAGEAAPEEAPVSDETRSGTPLREEPEVSDETRIFTPLQEAAYQEPRIIAPQAVTEEPEAPAKPKTVSHYDGTVWGHLGWWLLGVLLTVCTLGVGLAWAQCMVWRYRARHTVVCGRRMSFDGNGLELFEKYLMWGGLSVVTLGVYLLWVPLKVKSWHCSHLYMSGYRRRNAQPKTPAWRTIVVAVAAVLVFALLAGCAYLVYDRGLPWQQKEPIQPPESTPEATRPPESTPEPTRPPESTPEPTQPPESTPEPTQPPESTPEPVVRDTYTVTVNRDSILYIRSRPSTSGSKLGWVHGGDVVEPLEWSDGWAKITVVDEDGQEITGWVSGDFLKKNSG